MPSCVKPLFSLEDIEVTFSQNMHRFQALRNVSLSGNPRETLGIVGESGCGKSTLAKVLCLLERPTKGRVYFEGEELTQRRPKNALLLRKKMQFIFQDVDSSLNPRMSVTDHIEEALLTHGLATKKNLSEKVALALDQVHVGKELYDRFPYQLSGGQKQRVSIARALSVDPKLLICDEPVSSLDVSIRSQIIDLFLQLKKSRNLAFLFITHDFSTLRVLADRIAVMYLGSILEIGSCEDIYERSLSPYTQALLSCIPIAEPKKERSRKKIILQGELPSPVNPPTGCPFHTRCPIAQPLCKERQPPLVEKEKGHFIACHFPQRTI